MECEWEELFLEEVTSLESVNSGVPVSISKEEVENIVFSSLIRLKELVDDKLR